MEKTSMMRRKKIWASLIAGTLMCGAITFMPVSAYAKGENSTELDGTASGAKSVAIGNAAVASANSSVAVGESSGARGSDYAVAVGSYAQASGEGAISIGGGKSDSRTNATGANSIAVGSEALSGGAGAIALGKDSFGYGAKGVAIGYGASAGYDNSVALGAGATTTAANVGIDAQKYTYTVGGATVTTDYAGLASDANGTVSVGTNSVTRQIQYVAAGKIAIKSTDAVNGSQLYQTNQAVQAVADYVGTVTTGNYVIDSNTMGENINVLDTQLKSAYDAFKAATGADLTGVIAYDGDTDKGKVTLAGANGTTLANVKAGEVSASSKEAINGSQLYATNQLVAANSADIAGIKSDVSRLGDDIGRVGALSAAMAGLHPRFQSGNKGEVAMALGGYGGKKALALGGFYAPNERVMFSLGGAISEGGGNMYNLGVNFVLDKVQSRRSAEVMYTKNEVDAMMSTQGEQIKLLMNKLATLEAKIK